MSLHSLASRSLLAAAIVAAIAGAAGAGPEPLIDTDGDGLWDSWEISNFGNLTSQDQFGDPDGDGMNNLQEQTNITDPLTYDGPGAPTPIAPVCGAEIASLGTVLMVANAVDPQGTPLLYQFQLFSDAGLTILVAETSSPLQLVPQGGGATTSWPVPVNLLENGRYWWRARARDPYTFGPWSAPACSFLVNTINEPPTIPRINTPGFGAQVHTFTPTLRVENATDPDLDTLRYHFEVYADPGLSVRIASTPAAGVAEGAGGLTSWQVVGANPALQEDRFYYWHVRACDPDNLCGAWSATGQFFVTTINTPPEPPAITSPQQGTTVSVLRPDLVAVTTEDADLDPLVYDWTLATDLTFTAIVQSGANVEPQPGPLVRFRLAADLSEDTRYCWRVRADDGPATSPFATACFLVSERNDAPTAPVPVRPTDASGEVSTAPVFSWMPANDPEDDWITYTVEVTDAGGAPITSVTGVASTVTPIDRALVVGATYRWRVRAVDRQGASSAWSLDQEFTVTSAGEDGCCQTVDSGCSAAGTRGGPSVALALVLAACLRVRRRR